MNRPFTRAMFPLVGSLLALNPTPALSAPVVYQFTGATVGGELGGIADGTPFSGRFAYDDAGVDLNPNPTVGEYVYDAFEITIGADTLFADLAAPPFGQPPRIIVGNFSPSSVDSLTVFANPAGGSVGGFTSVAAFSVGFSANEVFSSDGLPGPGLTMHDFEWANISIVALLPNGFQASFGGSVYSLRTVPLPASLWLYGPTLLAAGAIARRGRPA